MSLFAILAVAAAGACEVGLPPPSVAYAASQHPFAPGEIRISDGPTYRGCWQGQAYQYQVFYSPLEPPESEPDWLATVWLATEYAWKDELTNGFNVVCDREWCGGHYYDLHGDGFGRQYMPLARFRWDRTGLTDVCVSEHAVPGTDVALRFDKGPWHTKTIARERDCFADGALRAIAEALPHAALIESRTVWHQPGGDIAHSYSGRFRGYALVTALNAFLLELPSEGQRASQSGDGDPAPAGKPSP